MRVYKQVKLEEEWRWFMLSEMVKESSKGWSLRKPDFLSLKKRSVMFLIVAIKGLKDEYLYFGAKNESCMWSGIKAQSQL